MSTVDTILNSNVIFKFYYSSLAFQIQIYIIQIQFLVARISAYRHRLSFALPQMRVICLWLMQLSPWRNSRKKKETCVGVSCTMGCIRVLGTKKITGRFPSITADIPYPLWSWWFCRVRKKELEARHLQTTANNKPTARGEPAEGSFLLQHSNVK